MRERRERLIRFAWQLLVPATLLPPLLLSLRTGDGDDGLALEMCLATGLLASSTLALTVLAGSRLRSLTRVFGIEQVLVSHRWLGLVTLAAVLAHVGFLALAPGADVVRLLTFTDAPPRARAATGATLCLLLICLLAAVRRRLRLPYEVWRYLHVTLAGGALALTGLHVYWLNHLIRDPVMRAWFVGLAGAVLLLLANRWVLRPLRLAGAGYVVRELRYESPTVRTLVLAPRHPWQRGMRFAPGQFAWIRVPGAGRFDVHPFTIASNAERPRALEFTIREAGDFTGRLAALRPGARVTVDGPYGAFTIEGRPVRRLLLVAGGVGITPMMSILRTLAHRAEPVPCHLVIGARAPSDLLFDTELDRLGRRLDLEVVVALSRPDPGWIGPTGHVDLPLLCRVLATPAHRSEADVFVCGPPPMVRTVTDAAAQLGVPRHHLHTEQFDMV